MSETAPETEPRKRRILALVGRPNVGKSALFNRIARERIAIVYEEAGVTRDRLERVIERDGERFTLVDTGGILAMDDERIADRIDAGVRAQAKAAIGDAAVVLLVVDVQEGLHPLDLEVARLLRKAGADVIIAANKADNETLDSHLADFARIGFPMYPVSALHGRGLDALLKAVYAKFPPQEAEPFGAGPEDEKDTLRIAIVGRPNGGKSSYINRLVKAERLIVSSVPGTTRDPIDIPFEYNGRKFVLIDTAGIRREARVDTAVERYSRYRMQDAIERADLLVLMLDSERGASLLDRQLAGLIAQSGKGCVIAVNKWDLSKQTEKQYLEKLAQDLPFMTHCPVVFLSAKTGLNVSRVLSTVAHVAEECRRTLPTGQLNRCLQNAYQASPFSGSGGKPVRMYYATQTGANPLRIRIFVNSLGRVPASFEQFLINSLRKTFGLDGTSIFLQFRERQRTMDADSAAAKAKRHPDLKAKRAKAKAGGKARARRRALPRG